MSFPIHLTAAEHFRAAREYFDDSGYTGAAAAERMGVERLEQIGRYEFCNVAARDRNLRQTDPLSILVRLFIAGQIVDTALVPSALADSLHALGLLANQDGRLLAPVMLYPAAGNYVVSDRFVNPDATPAATLSDFVFLPLQRTSADFLNFIPDSPCESFLDLGTGCGVAALLAARNFAAHAWGVDITDRAVHFAEFSRRLNGIANATFLRGDLYEPVEGKRFDRIVIHPPYALSSSATGYIYADGGDDGELLTRRALDGARRYLNPGGILTCWTTALDLKGAPLEQRVRAMLGEAPGESPIECDVAVLVEDPGDPETFAIATVASRNEEPRQLQVWRDRLTAMNVETFVYGGILVRRHAAPGTRPFTVRRRRSSQSDRRAVDWLLEWESAVAQPDRSALLASKPRARAEAELHVRHKFHEGSLVPREYLLRASYPFEAALSAPAWLAFLFSKCDGARTGAELLAEVSASVPSRDHFLTGLCALISGGFVEL